MKPTNTVSRDDRNVRPISPSFRSGGTRQKPSDASTEEIVRFVREYQMLPTTTQHKQNISAMKTRAVLPGITRKQSKTELEDDNKATHNVNHSSYNSFDTKRNSSLSFSWKEKESPDILSSNSLNRDTSIDKSMLQQPGYGMSSERRRSYHGVKRCRSMVDTSNGDMTLNSNRKHSQNSKEIRSNAMRQLPPIKAISNGVETVPRPSAPSPCPDSPIVSPPGHRSIINEHDNGDDNDDHIMEEDDNFGENKSSDNNNSDNETDKNGVAEIFRDDAFKTDKLKSFGKTQSVEVCVGEAEDDSDVDCEDEDTQMTISERQQVLEVEVEDDDSGADNNGEEDEDEEEEDVSEQNGEETRLGVDADDQAAFYHDDEKSESGQSSS